MKNEFQNPHYRGGGGLTSISNAAKGKLSWSCPKVVEIIRVRRTESTPYNSSFINPETMSYDFVERS